MPAVVEGDDAKAVAGEQARPSRDRPSWCARSRRSRGSAAPDRPSPSSMKAMRTPSESKVCTAVLLCRSRLLRRRPPLSSARPERLSSRANSQSSQRAAHGSPLIPHFANDQGVEKIYIGVREFQCMGARPPARPPARLSGHGRRQPDPVPLLLDPLRARRRASRPTQTDPAGCLVTPGDRRGLSPSGARVMATPPPILIAGGGIGGLALALALAQQRPQLDRAGAARRLCHGGRRHPARPQRRARAAGASAWPRRCGRWRASPRPSRVHDGRTGVLLAALPLGAWIAARHGAPYWVAHRGDLHGALLAAAAAEPAHRAAPRLRARLARADRGGRAGHQRAAARPIAGPRARRRRRPVVERAAGRVPDRCARSSPAPRRRAPSFRPPRPDAWRRRWSACG